MTDEHSLARMVGCCCLSRYHGRSPASSTMKCKRTHASAGQRVQGTLPRFASRRGLVGWLVGFWLNQSNTHKWATLVTLHDDAYNACRRVLRQRRNQTKTAIIALRTSRSALAAATAATTAALRRRHLAQQTSLQQQVRTVGGVRPQHIHGTRIVRQRRSCFNGRRRCLRCPSTATVQLKLS